MNPGKPTIRSESNCWYWLNPRPKLIAPAFEADTEFLEGFSDDRFQQGARIDNWKGTGYFQASRRENEGPLEDFLRTSGMLLVVSAKIKNALEDAQFACGQFLEVSILNPSNDIVANYYLVNVLNAVDALDRAASDFQTTRLKERDGRVSEWISYIRKPIFKRDCVAGLDLLVLPGYFLNYYVSNQFVQVCRGVKATGAGFKKIETTG